MSVTRDEHRVRIGESEVAVIGQSGLVEATWELFVDDERVDGDTRSGLFVLRGQVGDGRAIEAHIEQGALGPTHVTIVHDGHEVVSFKGFVA